MIAIVASILVSFFLEDLRQENEEVKKKNELVSDLSIVISEDLRQIQALQETLEESLDCIAQLQDDIASNHTVMTDMEALEAVLCVEVGHSFFPKDGVYEQMVATGALELIEGNELKRQLLEIFTHLKDRNYATSTEIDSFNITFRNAMLTNFRIRFSYDSDDGVFYGSRKIETNEFNAEYYQSNKFFGLLSQGSLYANMYLRQLNDIRAGYQSVEELAKIELAG
ncbi:MAG: hypothetical protein GWP50_12570 [Proteobacteria bacterium]|nr:hypothetical protein [Pseudomonadota bacterium]